MEYPGKLIQFGVTDPAVLEIKKKLVEKSIRVLDTTNPYFGINTKLAVKLFQERNQLYSDGIVGELTWERLFEGKIEVPVESRILIERVYEILRTQLFVREKTGMNDGYEVEQYLKAVGLTKGYPWCQAFLFWGFQKASRYLGVSNPMPRVAGVLKHRDTIKMRGLRGPGKIVEPEHAKPYDIGVIDYKHKYEGHIFMISQRKENNLFTIEGNTNSQGGREGNGVFERNRLISTLDCCIRY